MRFLVGARYACLTCLRRGIRESCARCESRGDVVDLASESGRRQLALRRSAGPARESHAKLMDPLVLRALPAGRQVLWVGTRAVFIAAVLAMLFTRVMPTPTNLMELVTRMLVATFAGFVAVGLWMLLVTGTVLVCLGAAGVVAQSIAAAAWVLGCVVRVAPDGVSRIVAKGWRWLTVAPQRYVMQRALATVDRLFVARVRVEAFDGEPLGPRIAGVMCGDDSPIVTLATGHGGMELRDATAREFEVQLADGSRVAIDVAAGAIECAPIANEMCGDQVLMPAWIDAGTELRAHTQVTRVRAGARVVIRGGELTDELDAGGTRAGFRSAPTRRVLRGSVGQPVLVQVDALR